ncbi:DUF2478 domain-containing protein [Pseudoruegeria sp. SHC-113]|uniref:DUF2478 domain-containing protein n=1 Tax=Pseudoruegeria sp. SHC-113 TaxID=2855439 RepID=UPI0021BA5A0B|nr:DUF2478 domain-containing protein [Pseudoruegeria sp. SHC-113]MCT8159498.1 DUF2478 domain-containing protein [Pseudoruegeria sp. SHC-113]
MNIAYTMAPGRGDTDLLLHGLAEALIAGGHRPAGVVQINTERPCDGPCDMDVQVLPDGPVIRISQSLGAEARGCRLDPAALEQAVGLVEAQLATRPDCLIVNKFGKHEADGRGFRPLIAEALALEIPVIVGLNRMNEAAFASFTEGLAQPIAPEASALRAWLDPLLTERHAIV